MTDGMIVSECGSFDVVGCPRGRRVEEVSEVGSRIYGLFVTWAWHYYPDRYSKSCVFRDKQSLQRKTSEVTIVELC